MVRATLDQAKPQARARAMAMEAQVWALSKAMEACARERGAKVEGLVLEPKLLESLDAWRLMHADLKTRIHQKCWLRGYQHFAVC
jgi:hypothetical protein